MKLQRLWLLLLASALVLAFSVISISCDDDDDDDDDDDIGDDDTGDDDTGDDDTGDDDTGDDDTGDDDTGDDGFWNENFDAMTPGPLPAPWVVEVNNATIEVAALKAGSGNVMSIDDSSPAESDGGMAQIELSTYTELAAAHTFNYDMVMSTGNSIGLAGVQYDSDFAYYFPEFYVDFEDTKLTAAGSAGYMDCVTFNPAIWHTLAVNVDPVGKTFSVLLDGSATSCTSLAFIYGDNPFVGYQFIGYDGESWYGVGGVDNLSAAVLVK